MRQWAIRIGEVRALNASTLLVFGARIALRAAPWVPATATAEWDEALELTLAAAAGDARDGRRARDVSRALRTSGAIACNRLDGTPDEALGRCMNYATSALVQVLDAADVDALPARKKAILDAARSAASIPAVLAHAGRAPVAPGLDAVAVAATAMWDAFRADIPAIALATPCPRTAAQLEALAPLWPSGRPAWVPAP